MNQVPLFTDEPVQSSIINIASVPHRSPFRYPGGKTWLVPHIRRWLTHLTEHPSHFIEPFAGGAIVGLSVAFEHLADHVTLVELDEQVAAVWQTIINDSEGEWLADQIRQFNLTADNIERLLSCQNTSVRERAFCTIVRNRVNHGGILAPGAGKLKAGEHGKGIASRWYPETLAKRILNIERVQSQLSFIQGDGLNIIQKYAHDLDKVWFIDPPYTADGKKAGQRLYTHNEINHETLFELVSSIQGQFLMTYDDNPTIRLLAQTHSFDTQIVPMKNTHHTRMNELIIGRDLNWMRG